ncbi:hypothetical protein JYK00_05970 [Thermosipho ferrireducens]|uniref:Prepilin-type N-terminal cleavage/methylation domain-containing protein n=1 Tax=Thermosipho ferrireducens TaxID=2571116 RepID=A0ABX7S4C0_9BACT|nr:hypothetical protein [Thermosipho ferrireducens]QTA37288.1 hypothetical protein JYK00_05970 [Thermosipho ferrireducens]
MSTNEGYTFVEFLIVLMIISIFGLILTSSINNTLKSYEISKTNLRRLYSENNINFLFDTLEKELRWVGSGGVLLENLTNAQEITDHTGWIASSIDYDPASKTLYVSYLIAQDIILQRSANKYYPLYDTIIDGPKTTDFYGYAITMTKYDSNAPGFSTKWKGITAILDENGVPISTVTHVGEASSLTIGEFSGNDKYAILIKNPGPYILKILNQEYYFELFRQTRITYIPGSSKVIFERYIPTLNSSITTDLLDNVENFQIYLLYQDSGLKEIEIGEAKTNPPPGFSPQKVRALKFKIIWESPWKQAGKSFQILKEKVFVLPNF